MYLIVNNIDITSEIKNVLFIDSRNVKSGVCGSRKIGSRSEDEYLIV